MKIDYDLVNKVGATHYCDKTYRLYKVSAMTLLVYIDDDWKLCLAGVAALNHIKPIPPKRTRTEYEKVTESIFDLRDEFERGELYCKFEHAREYTQITNAQTLSQALHRGYCYRLVEKEIDWRDEVHTKLQSDYHWSTPIAEVISDESDYFLELCRVALRANGELD